MSASYLLSHNDASYLVQLAAHRAFPPLVAANLDELLSKLFIGILGQAIVDAREFFSKETLLAA